MPHNRVGFGIIDQAQNRLVRVAPTIPNRLKLTLFKVVRKDHSRMSSDTLITRTCRSKTVSLGQGTGSGHIG